MLVELFLRFPVICSGLIFLAIILIIVLINAIKVKRMKDSAFDETGHKERIAKIRQDFIDEIERRNKEK